MLNVLIVGPSFGIESIYSAYGYNPIFSNRSDAKDQRIDLVSFMGGVDINPKLYGEAPVSETQAPNNHRDTFEIAMYHKYKTVPKVGICRGAQLLNVLNGGKLYQHVNNHNGADHEVIDIYGNTIRVSSVHHQMMIPSANSQLIAWAKPRATFRKNQHGIDQPSDKDPEILFIPEDKALLFQGHPEFGPDQCTRYFFHLIDTLIWKDAA